MKKKTSEKVEKKNQNDREPPKNWRIFLVKFWNWKRVLCSDRVGTEGKTVYIVVRVSSVVAKALKETFRRQILVAAWLLGFKLNEQTFLKSI